MIRTDNRTVAFVVLLVGLLSTLSSPVAYAQDATQTNSVETSVTPVENKGLIRQVLEEKRAEYEVTRESIGERRDEVIQKIASTSELMRQRIQERRLQLAPRVKDRVMNLFANVTARIEAAIARLENIASRIESRASKIDAAGGDTTVARAHIDEARRAMNDAREALTSAKATSLESIVDAQSPLELFSGLRSKVVTVREALIRARQALMDAVKALEKPSQPAPTATSTATTTVE